MFIQPARRLANLLVLIVTALFLQVSNAQQSHIELTREMVDATNSFLAGLTEMQRNSGSYEFDDEERLNWHFIPRDRNGIPLKNLNGNQL